MVADPSAKKQTASCSSVLYVDSWSVDTCALITIVDIEVYDNCTSFVIDSKWGYTVDLLRRTNLGEDLFDL